MNLPSGRAQGTFNSTQLTILGNELHTVCEEARCPNIHDCWAKGTATFMVMGDTCTRGCRFCSVKTAKNPAALDPDEPRNVALAIQEMDLDYVVITSVDRDDVEDGGASHFAACIQQTKLHAPKTKIEVLIPDFAGHIGHLLTVVEAGAEVAPGDTIAEIDSVKATSEIYAPLAGKVTEVNERFKNEDELPALSSSPEDEGWLFKLEVADAAKHGELMDRVDVVSVAAHVLEQALAQPFGAEIERRFAGQPRVQVPLLRRLGAMQIKLFAEQEALRTYERFRAKLYKKVESFPRIEKLLADAESPLVLRMVESGVALVRRIDAIFSSPA